MTRSMGSGVWCVSVMEGHLELLEVVLNGLLLGEEELVPLGVLAAGLRDLDPPVLQARREPLDHTDLSNGNTGIRPSH
jgi:hypothetical protein